MRFIIPLCTTLLVALVPVTRGQVRELPYEFDVATIWPSVDVEHGSKLGLRPGGRLEVIAATLKRLIMAAYDTTELQIAEGPAWLNQARWDITATAEGLPSSVQPEQIAPLLKKLLGDRFGLRVHREMREMPVYRLVVHRGGAKLKATVSDPPGGADVRGGAGGFHMEARHLSMPRLAQLLSRRAERPVVDRTGLGGDYDLTLEWTPQMAVGPEQETSDGPTLFTALREQLGLRLEAGRELVEVLVVDEAARPTEN